MLTVTITPRYESLMLRQDDSKLAEAKSPKFKQVALELSKEGAAKLGIS